MTYRHAQTRPPVARVSQARTVPSARRMAVLFATFLAAVAFVCALCLSGDATAADTAEDKAAEMKEEMKEKVDDMVEEQAAEDKQDGKSEDADVGEASYNVQNCDPAGKKGEGAEVADGDAEKDADGMAKAEGEVARMDLDECEKMKK